MDTAGTRPCVPHTPTFPSGSQAQLPTYKAIVPIILSRLTQDPAHVEGLGTKEKEFALALTETLFVGRIDSEARDEAECSILLAG